MKKIFWLDGFEGKVGGGAYYRSKIAIDINDFEKKFDVNVVGIGTENALLSDKPSWNVEFIVEAKTHKGGWKAYPECGNDDKEKK
tara:strand:+ start:1802 stop:2056 length:255 start_codon:yes stop_codon:yes gene_type:complete